MKRIMHVVWLMILLPALSAHAEDWNLARNVARIEAFALDNAKDTEVDKKFIDILSLTEKRKAPPSSTPRSSASPPTRRWPTAVTATRCCISCWCARSNARTTPRANPNSG